MGTPEEKIYMAAQKKKNGAKGEAQKKRADSPIATSVMVTSLGSNIRASDALPLILSGFRKTEKEDRTLSFGKAALGERIATRKGVFSFYANDEETLFKRKMKILAADINIIVLDREISKTAETELRQTKQDNLLFVSCLKEINVEARQYVKKMFGKHKIYQVRDIPRVIESKKILNRKRHTRPLMVADSVEKVSERSFKITGSLDRGFTTPNILLGGTVQARITEIEASGRKVNMKELKILEKEEIYRTEEERKENEIANIPRQINIAVPDEEYSSENELGHIKVDMESDDDDEVSNEEMDDIDEMSEGEMDDDEMSEINNHDQNDHHNHNDHHDHNNPHNDQSTSTSDDLSEYEKVSSVVTKSSDLLTKYKGFKGFRSINLGERGGLSKKSEELSSFRTQDLPSYYAYISFVASERARKKILAKKSPVPVRVPLVITVELENWEEMVQSAAFGGFLSVQGLFDYEGLPTVCTLSFESEVPLSRDMCTPLTFDHGFCFAAPQSVLVGSGTEIVKCKREATSGTVCFIGPLVLTDEKVSIVAGEKVIGSGMQVLRKDPVIVKTVIFKGRPIKINKRSCVIGKMFRSREEVKYFRDVKLYSSDRKEGRIKKPLGEQGLMKCYFCPPVKHSEKVYMEIAKRVFLDY